MPMPRQAARAGPLARVAAALRARLRAPPAGLRAVPAPLRALAVRPFDPAGLGDDTAGRIARDPGLAAAAESLLRSGAAGAAAALWLSEAVGAADPALARRFVAAALAHDPAEPRLRRRLVTLLDQFGDTAVLADRGAAMLDAGTPADPALAFDLWRAAARAGLPALATRAGAALDATAGPAGALWQARRARTEGRDADAMALFRGALAGDDPAVARKALRDAAVLAGRGDRLAEDADLVVRAVEDGLVADPHLRAIARMAQARGGPLPQEARAAFDHLIDHVLPGRMPYQPEDRLLMVAPSLACGGMERVLAHTVRALGENGTFAQVDLALSRYAPGAPSAFFAALSGLSEGRIHLLASDSEPNDAIAALPSATIAEAQALHDLITAIRPRVVHAWNDRLGLIAAYSALHAGTPRIVIHLHHLRPTRDPAEAADAAHYPLVYQRLTGRPELRFAFCARAAMEDYLAFWQTPFQVSMAALHNGFDPLPPITETERATARNHLGLPPNAPVVGTLTRFAPVKQPLLWLKTARLILDRRPDAWFLMAGDGELAGEVRARATALGLAERLVLPGRLDDIRPALAAIDVMMLSSASEGLPTAAIEAQLAGRAVVGFDVGGTRETLKARETGDVVPPGDTAALAAAALAWLDRAEVGHAARAFATEAFSTERYLAGLAALYRAETVA